MGTRTPLREESLRGFQFSPWILVHAQFINHHLQIEEELEDLICSQLRDPKKYDLERLGFAQKVALARALAGPQTDDHLWEILLKFNETRNAIAHRTRTPPEDKFNELSKLVTNAVPSLPVADDTEVMISALKICIWFIQDIKQSLPPPP